MEGAGVIAAPTIQGRRARGFSQYRLVAAAALLLAGCASAPAQELNSRIEGLIAAAKIGTARVGISAVDLHSGRVLAEIDADVPFIPASNMKVLTSGAALMVLGDDFVFRTELIIRPAEGGGHELIIRGSGDPALGDPAVLDRMSPRMSIQGLLGAMAGAVKGAGVERITQVVVDDRIFDRQAVHPTWPRDQLDRWYCAPVAGINFNTNVLSFFPAPGAEGPGSPPAFSMEPDIWWLEVENRAQTVAQGNNSVWFTRAAESNRYTMFGQVRQASHVAIHITAHEVPLLMGQLLATQLPSTGVSIGTAGPASSARLPRGELQSVLGTVRLASSDEALEGRTIAVITTHIRDILDRCNSDSQNLYAEALLKRIGHEVTREPGSWSNGASVLRMTISESLGPQHAASTVIADGSGMSRENRIAPRTLTSWLQRIESTPRFGDLFINSLATPGDGTLRRRFGGNGTNGLRASLHAKSGKLNHVRCLSGYLTDAGGRRIAFSIMVNELREGEPALNALKLHEDIVLVLDRWLAAQAPVRTGAR
jgi:serine-type D-Ala-D-Ala carboxypeptidase/endopeptidase (penicillin-binding protein 4)